MDAAMRNMINSLTEDILHSFQIPIPIQNIEGLVEKLGGTVQEDIRCSEGSVEKRGNSFVITVSPFTDEKRRRFTIAHVLGYLFLHMGYMIRGKFLGYLRW